MLNYFADPIVLLQGLLIGTIFGFLLHQTKVSKFNKIINQFLLKDFTMIRVMISAIITGIIILYSAYYLGFINIIPMPHSSTISVIVGGLILGIGLAISGYCPGTTFAAIGQGSKNAIFAAVGLFIGAGIYAELHKWFESNLFQNAIANITTLPQIFKLSPSIFILLFITLLISFLYLIKNK